MNRKLLAVALVGLVILPLMLLIQSVLSGWSQFKALFDFRNYFFNLAMWFWMAFGLMVCAFCLRQKRGWPSLLMLLSSLVGILGSLDLLVLLTRTESSGPAGDMCISHRNWRLRAVHENSKGFWEDELPAQLDIAVVGDSFTWGQGISDRRLRFTDRLSEAAGVKFWNFGRPGASTHEESQEILPSVAACKPKVVVVCYLSNDITCEFEPYYPPVPMLSQWERRLMQASPTYNYGYWRFFGRSGESYAAQRYFFTLILNYLNPQSMANHKLEIQQMTERIRAMGAKPVAVILPFPHMFMDVRPQYRKALYEAVVRAFQEGGAPVIELQDMEAAFPPGHFEVGPIDVHPSARVHEALATRIFEWFKLHPEYLK